MIGSRRHFVKLAGVATAYGALGRVALAAADEPALGLIFPPLDYPIPPDAKLLYPAGVRFLGNGVGLPGGMTLAGYDEAIPRVLPAAEALAKQGAKVISVFGSSLTFYKGARFNEELTRQVTKLTGLPSTTQSNGLVDGLRTVNAHRVAVATAYTDVVTGRLQDLPRGARLRGGCCQGAWLRANPGRRRHAQHPVQAGDGGPRQLEERRRAGHILRRFENARPDRPSRGSNQGARGLVDAARSDEWCPVARRQSQGHGLRNGPGKSVERMSSVNQ